MKNIDDLNKLAIYDVFVSFFNVEMHLSLQLFHFNVFNFRKILFFSFCSAFKFVALVAWQHKIQ